MKKIAILYEFLSEIGGLERVMVNNYNWLKGRLDASLYFAYINEEARKSEMYHNIKIKKVSSFFIKNEPIEVMWFCLNPFIKRLNTNLTISHSFLASYYCYRKNIPYIIYLHHPPNFLYFKSKKEEKEWINSPKRFLAWFGGKLIGAWLRNLDKKCVNKSKLLFVNSSYTKERIKKIYKRDATVVYPTKDESFRILGMKKKDFIYTHGRVIPDKKFEYAIEALKYLPNEKLIISGTIEKDYQIKLERLIRELNLQKRVNILGRISQKDLIRLYNEAKVFIMTAPNEDFGITPIEAMSCGTPVIAWNDNSGPSESVVENTNGFLAKPYDIKDLAEKTKKALNKKWDRNKIRKTAEKFSSKIQSKIFVKEIEKMIKKYNL